MHYNWHNLELDEIFSILGTSKDGLTDSDAAIRLNENGFNTIKVEKKRNIVLKFLDQFKSFTIVILLIAAIISLVIGILNNDGILDSIVIFVVIIINAIIGVIEENSAEKSIESLEKLSVNVCKVKRNNEIFVIPSTELVVGDIVLLECGDVVPADMRVISSNDLKVLESSLTGEPDSVEKNFDKCLVDTPLAERSNMLYSSSLVTYGRGQAVVVLTGMNTEIGKIASMLNGEEQEKTPLQEKLDDVGKTLGLICIVICLILFIIGLLSGRDILEMFMVAVSLGVAAIPEGLVAVSTIVLSIGVRNMVKKNVLIRKLYSVETLGSTSVICTDKTGTLTQNKMSVVEWFCNDKYNDDKSLESLYLMENCLLCNDIEFLDDNSYVGDPTEKALYDIGVKYVGDDKLLSLKRVDEIPFDSDRKLMTVVHAIDGKYIYFVKGAVSELLGICDSYMFDGKTYDIVEYKDIILDKNNEMASKALRVLGFAIKKTDNLLEKDDYERNLTFIGLVGMIDPPRDGVLNAVKCCYNAGIKTVMITGDQKNTAVAIAKKLGILKDDSEVLEGKVLDKMSDEDLVVNVDKYSVYSRVMPEHKMRIVSAWQKRGNIVAMTGDGVNDAPALKKADIGCSMGVIGTEVARDASDLVLADDDFSTIVCAVKEGRRIYNNILKVIQFLLSSNIGEIVLIFIATLFAPIILKALNINDVNSFDILLPIHILWINLITDSIPAFSLSFDDIEDGAMNKKPNNRSKVFDRGVIYRIIYQGILIGLVTLAAFIIGVAINDVSTQERIKIGQTMAFATISLVELLHVFNVRSVDKSFISGIMSNKVLVLTTIISIEIVFGVLYLPLFSSVFKLSELSFMNIIIVIILSFIPTIIIEIFKLFKFNDIRK